MLPSRRPPVAPSSSIAQTVKGLLRFHAMDHARNRPKKLRDYCFDILAKNFLPLTLEREENKDATRGAPPWEKLTSSELKEVYDRLSLHIPLLDAIRYIPDEDYWRRRVNAQILTNSKSGAAKTPDGPGTVVLHHLKTLGVAPASNGLDSGDSPNASNPAVAAVNPLDHGGSWKQAFLECWVRKEIVNLPAEPSPEQMEQLIEILRATSDSVFRLEFDELPSHLDLSLLIARLPCLSSLKVSFGRRRKLGMQYDRALFGMKLEDAINLSRGVKLTQTLHKLALPHNLIDDELIKASIRAPIDDVAFPFIILVAGLQNCHFLTELDLSHNRICDRGARKISSLLSPSNEIRLSKLSLADNNIHANGAMHIGRHLPDNDSLQDLSLRLNRCEDNGASHILQNLMPNSTLRSLDLSSNDITIQTLPYLTSCLAENGTLASLNLSANPLYTNPEEPAMAKADGFTRNPPSKKKGKTAITEAEFITVPGFEDLQIEDKSIIGVLIQCLATKNTGLRYLGLRSSKFPPVLEQRITRLLTRRDLERRGIRVDAYEWPWPEEIKEPEEVGEDSNTEEQPKESPPPQGSDDAKPQDE
ncbi:T-complex-associated testis-expressed protein 1 [Perkinsus chesapeaki]|uniref:T-complex-associated testis-expressed protein 1 n=1 Tax=Perkinsus chesapeaki TaxID=330153 RepID=A0A7J6M5L0_PERCH|nr:T-complex-associated testis-expressed protein 1 [Perkinsus chesapeaki]